MTNFNWLAIRDPTSKSAYAQDCIARSSDRINYDLQKAEQNQEVKRQVAISQRREKTQNYLHQYRQRLLMIFHECLNAY